MDRKSVIRKEILEKRKNLTIEQVEDWSEGVCAHIVHNAMFMETEAVYGYMPIQNEADVTSVLQQALSMGKKVALPRVNGEDMDFYLINSLEDVEEGSFHVMEPKTDCPLYESPGLMLVPLVVFDFKGNRIGYGKGFYDRYMKRTENIEKTLMGVGYEMQRVDEIPADESDYPLDYFVTEKVFKKRG